MSEMERIPPLPEEMGYIVWKGKTPKSKRAMMVSIFGEEYFFAHRGNGWVAKVDLNDPKIARALSRPHSLVHRLKEKNPTRSVQQLMCDRTPEEIIELIFNTNSVEWLLGALATFVEEEQNQLTKAAEERLAQLGVAPDGMPLAQDEPKEEPTNEPKTKKGKRAKAPVEAGVEEPGPSGGAGVDEDNEPVSLPD